MAMNRTQERSNQQADLPSDFVNRTTLQTGKRFGPHKLALILKENRWLIAIMLCGIAAALTYHFVFGHPRTTLIYDARSYLWTSARFAQFFIDLSHFHWSPQLLIDRQFQEHVMNDGPLFTSFIGLVFALFQHVPVEKDWFKIEIIQSILHGLTSGFVYLITLRLLNFVPPNSSDRESNTKNSAGARVGAIAAGLIWAFYPAANVASGFLCTESFVVFSVSAFIWSAVSNYASRARDFLCGLCAGLVILLKPALVPAVVLSCLARLVFSPKKAAAISALVIALTLTVAPWAMYTHFVCGKMQITTPRFAGYNMAMGSDTEVEGRLALPNMPLTNMFSDEKVAPYFVASQWKYHTLECLQMTAKKLTRLLAFSWNDYRHKFFGLDATQQRVFHLALLFLGLAGFSLAAFTRKLDRDAMPALVVMTFMWSPLTYLLFEANSRYGFTMMPFYAVFAGSLIATIFVARRNWKPLALSLISGALLTTVIVQAASWAVPGASQETVIQLKPEQTLVSQINLKNVKEPTKAYEALIFVDGDRSIEKAALSFNGHNLNEPLRHLRYFESDIYDGYYVSKEMAHFMTAEPEDFRQWRAARIPKEWINWSGDNQIRLVASEVGGTVYGDTAKVPERLPSFKHNCPNRLLNADSGLDNRIPLLRPSRSVTLNSFIEGPNAVPINGSSRVRIAIVTDSMRVRKKIEPVSRFSNPTNEPSKETLIFSESLNPERFPAVMRSATNDGTVQTNRFVMNLVSPSIEIKLPPPNSEDNIYKLRLTGRVQSKKPGRVSALLCNGRFAVVSKVPSAMDCGPEWRTFELQDDMPALLLRSGPTAQSMVALALYPGPWLDESGYGASKSSADARFRDLKLSVWSSKQLNLAGKQVFVY